MMKTTIDLILVSQEPDRIDVLFGVAESTEVNRIAHEDSEIRVDSRRIRPGISAVELILGLIVTVSLNTQINLLSNYLWEKVAKRGEEKLIRPDTEMVLVSKEALDEYIRERVAAAQSEQKS